MSEFSVLINTAITMLILMGVGFGAAKFKVIDETASKRLSSLIVNVGQPFLMISSLVDSEFSVENLKTGAFVIVIAAAVHLTAIIISKVVTLGFKDIKEKQITRYAMVFSNNAFFGFPILRAVFGATGVFWGSFYCVVFNVLCWTWGIFILSRANKDIKTSPKNLFLNIGIISVIIGLVIYVSRIDIPDAVSSALGYVGGLCTPISMLLVGAAISRMSPKMLFTSKGAYLTCLIKLIVLPLIVGGAAKLIGLSHDMILFSAIMAGMPTASMTEAFAEKYDVVPGYASLCVGMSALFSIGTVPLIVILFN